MNQYSGKTLVFLLAFGGALAPAMAAVPAQSAAGAPNASRHQTIPAALRPAFYQALAKDPSAAYVIGKDGCAALPKQQLTVCFDRHGAHFTGAGAPLVLQLVLWGRQSAGDANGDKLVATKPVMPTIRGNEVRYAHGDLRAWWRVLPVGFEQGFTIAKRPAGNGRLVLMLAKSRDAAGAPSIRHSRAGGNPAKNTLAWGELRYGRLVVTDANGKIVPATLEGNGHRVLIAVNDSRATYPLTVDPLVWIEQKMRADDGLAYDEFGGSVAMDGTTALVGTGCAPPYNPDIGYCHQGAVYVFHESNGKWTQTQKLTASDGTANDGFGYSIAVSGTTALIGAYCVSPNINGCGPGAAYAFNESGGIWTQAAKLTPSDGIAGDRFGVRVALAGTTAVIGASLRNNWAGAAYVFNESNGNWNQMEELTASDGAEDDQFGVAIALAGNTVLIGAPGHNSYAGAVYVFDESNGDWSQTQELTPSNEPYGFFGGSIAVDGTTAVVGAKGLDDYQGAAFVFTNTNGTWSQTQELTVTDGGQHPEFGDSISIDGAIALVGAPCATHPGDFVFCGPGTAYVFRESNGILQQAQKLMASDGTAGDYFGGPVALFGTTALIGASGAKVNGDTEQGAAYFYGESDLGLNVSAPQAVAQDQQYVSQAIATNNGTTATPAVSATITVPAAASFVSADASQGSCSQHAGVVTCNFGQISGNAGTATANVTLKAVDAPATTIENTASIAKATPPLAASAATTITEAGGCPDGYIEYDGTLNAHQLLQIVTYEAAAGQENAILAAPTGSQLYLRFENGSEQKTLRIPGNEIHRQAPAGTYTWAAKAGDTGGSYTFCSKHP